MIGRRGVQGGRVAPYQANVPAGLKKGMGRGLAYAAPRAGDQDAFAHLVGGLCFGPRELPLGSVRRGCIGRGMRGVWGSIIGGLWEEWAKYVARLGEAPCQRVCLGRAGAAAPPAHRSAHS